MVWVMTSLPSRRNYHNFQMFFEGMDSLFTFIILILGSTELKSFPRNWVSSFPVQLSHPADLLTYCYVHKVAHLLWIFIEVFLGRKRLGCRKNVCYHCYLSGAFGGVGNLARYHCVCACVCLYACACVSWGCFLILIIVSLAAQVHQPSISVIHFLLCV